MGISLNMPADAESIFRQAMGSHLEQCAFDGLVLEGYRSGKLGTGQVRRLLGLETRIEAEAWLAARGATMNYSLEDLEQDRATIKDLFGKSV